MKILHHHSAVVKIKICDRIENTVSPLHKSVACVTLENCVLLKKKRLVMETVSRRVIRMFQLQEPLNSFELLTFSLGKKQTLEVNYKCL